MECVHYEKIHLTIVGVIFSDEILGLLAFKTSETSEVRQFDTLLINKMSLQSAVSQKHVTRLNLRKIFAKHFQPILSHPDLISFRFEADFVSLQDVFSSVCQLLPLVSRHLIESNLADSCSTELKLRLMFP